MMKKLGTSRNLEIDATDGSKTAVKASAKNEFAFFHGQLNLTSLRVVQYVNVGKFSWSWIPGSKSRVRISFFVGSLTVVQCASKKSTKMRKCRMHMQSCCFFGHESKCFLTFSMRWLLPRLLPCILSTTEILKFRPERRRNSARSVSTYKTVLFQ